MNPIVDGVSQEYKGKVDVQKLDANGGGKAAFNHYRMTGHPSYILFGTDGTKAWQDIGLKTRDELAQQIEAVLSKP